MYYKQIFIKSVDDLPKEDGTYIVHLNYGKIAYRFDFIDAEYWEDIDWYLQPIEITDSDIEAWAKTDKCILKSIDGIKHAIIGAKAFRDGEIKHIEK